MGTSKMQVKPKAGFSGVLKKGIIRELYEKHQITQAQYEQLMQLQRSH